MRERVRHCCWRLGGIGHHWRWRPVPDVCLQIFSLQKAPSAKRLGATEWPTMVVAARVYFCNKFETWYLFYFFLENLIFLKFCQTS
jgi:hypothetical protein